MLSPVTTIQVVSFLDLLATSLLAPQLPPQARSLGCSHLLVGLMGVLYPGFQLVSSPMTGSLSDLKGRNEIFLVTLSLSGIAYTLLGVTNSLLLFFTLRAVLGITKHTQLLARALTPDYVKDKKELSQVYRRLNTLKHAGLSIGPIIGGHIVEMFPDKGFTIIAFIVGAIFAFNSGLIRRLPKVKREEKKKEKGQLPITSTLINTVKKDFKESVEQLYKIDWNKYGEIFSFKLLIYVCVGVYFNNYALFLTLKHDVSPITIGYISSLFSAVRSLSSFFIGHINKYYEKDWDYTERNLHVFIVLTLSLIGVAFASDVSVYTAFIIPLAIACTMGILTTNEVILSKTDKNQTGTVMGVVNNIRSLAGVISPLISGIISEYVGVLYVVYVAIILAASGTYKRYLIRFKSVETKKKLS